MTDSWFLIWIILIFNPDTEAVEFEVYRKEVSTYEECVSELAELDAEYMGTNLNYQVFCTENSNLEIVLGELIIETDGSPVEK